MNAVRKLEATDTQKLTRTNRQTAKSNGSQIIYLAGKSTSEDKKVTLDYLNEKLAYFYNNGGPIMDI